jgi:hypothetical protein
VLIGIDWRGVKYETPIVKISEAESLEPSWQFSVGINDLEKSDTDKEMQKLERLKRKKISKIPYGILRVSLWDWNEKNSCKLLFFLFKALLFTY